MKRNNLFVNTAINVVLVLVLLAIAAIGFSGTSVTVSGNDAIYRGNSSESNVSLMFNVYWGTEYIEDILKILDSNNIKTTFFIGGSWAAKNTETLKLIYENGHEIGNHGYSHKDAEALNYKQNLDEISLTNKLLKEVLGVDVCLFAPPSGSIGSDMFKATKELNQKVIMWSRDTIDWRDKDEDLVLKRATSDIQNGELLLLHPTEHTLKALPKIIRTLKENEFNIVTVSKCIAPSQL